MMERGAKRKREREESEEEPDTPTPASRDSPPPPPEQKRQKMKLNFSIESIMRSELELERAGQISPSCESGKRPLASDTPSPASSTSSTASDVEVERVGSGELNQQSQIRHSKQVTDKSQQGGQKSKKSSSSSSSSGSTWSKERSGHNNSNSTNHLLKPKACHEPRLAPFECHLDNLELWHRFDQLDTEMIITKQGRRMFPPVRVNFSVNESGRGCQSGNVNSNSSGLNREANANSLQLNPRDKYQVLMDILPFDNKRYRYAYHKSSWQQAGKADPPSSTKLFLHPDGPFTLEQLKRQVISFEKIKLTNNDANKHGFIVLNSMHKYQPRIHLVLWRGKESQNLANAPISHLEQEQHKTFIFSETIFTAVTAYQNHSITKLKIDSNPFAKGFRDSSRLTDLELESMQDLMSDGQCPFSPPRAPPHGFPHFLFGPGPQNSLSSGSSQLNHHQMEDPASALLRERTFMALDSFLQQQFLHSQAQHQQQQQQQQQVNSASPRQSTGATPTEVLISSSSQSQQQSSQPSSGYHSSTPTSSVAPTSYASSAGNFLDSSGPQMAPPSSQQNQAPQQGPPSQQASLEQLIMQQHQFAAAMAAAAAASGQHHLSLFGSLPAAQVGQLQQPASQQHRSPSCGGPHTPSSGIKSIPNSSPPMIQLSPVSGGKQAQQQHQQGRPGPNFDPLSFHLGPTGGAIGGPQTQASAHYAAHLQAVMQHQMALSIQIGDHQPQQPIS